MAETLYRKYRPQTFAEIVNQQHIRITLQHALEQDRIAHAYLFAGPRGVGKTTIARLVARAVNCKKPKAEGEPCNACEPCLAMNQGRNLDIIEIDAASQTGVDNVRENIIQSARVSPSISTYKVFIIDEVHMLSLAAFNALLKLLEEPPAHALFILATTEIHRVPETIISRTQRFDFKKLSAVEIAGRLHELANQEKRKLEDGVAERIARYADGSLRDAESMLGQLFSFQDQTISQEIADLVLPRSNEVLIVQILQHLVHRQTGDALRLFHSYADEGGDIPAFVHDMVLLSRALLLGTVDPTMLEAGLRPYDPSTAKELLALTKSSDVNQTMRIVEALIAAERQLYKGAMMELPVEVAFVKIGGSQAEPNHQTASPPTAKPSAAAPAMSPKKSSSQTEAGALPLETVTAAWKKVQQELNGSQPSLRLSIQQTWVVGVEANQVQLGVPFDLHRKRLTDPKHRKQLESRLEKALNQPVTISVRVESDAPAPKSEPVVSKSELKTGDLWDQVVESFG